MELVSRLHVLFSTRVKPFVCKLTHFINIQFVIRVKYVLFVILGTLIKDEVDKKKRHG